MPKIDVSDEAYLVLKKEFCIKSTTTDKVRIVILQRGWVMVGRYSESGDDCKLESASVIRIWGTSHGLGEIAQDGPTSLTKLDKCPTVRFHRLTVVATMDCEESKWVKHLC